MLKKMTSLLLAALFVLTLSLPQFSETASAAQVQMPAEYEAEISYLVDRNIVEGYPDGLFHGGKGVTREQAAVMVGRAIDLNGAKQNTKFPDVDRSSYASGFIQSAVNNGVITGFPDGTYKPNKVMTRSEMAYLISKAFDLKETSNVSYNDVTQSKNYFASVNKLTTAGIAEGMPGGYFKPKNKITRTQLALFVARSMNSDFKVSQDDDENLEVIDEKVVNADILNVRSGPSTGYQIVGKLKDGESVDIYKREGNWAYITNGNVKGYVHTAYLVDKKGPEVIDRKVVSATSLNVRSGPGTNHGIIGSLKTGESVDIYKKEGNWAYIAYGNTKGYVSMYYLIDKPNTSKIVTLDPGHGGHDPGARGHGLVEKNVVLDVGLKARKYLKNAGIKVRMTRDTDRFHSLDRRVDIAKQNNSDTFVSIHANAFMESANGVETYYYAAGLTNREYSSLKLAEFINERLYKEMNMSNRGVKNSGFRVIKANSLPAVLTEIGFVTNNGDAAKLKTQKYREKAGKAIALGIVDYYNWKE
ncbi:N-acetylmuramoyl-L-alanine amidase [Thalassobacillus sp. CUG 92003]|uniref:N-acetylmuramoyl-L-alanine amidase n=1 Tax=Thalassobacillus sp. CUG 92003 TaxID=2736641 RepID=UPI0015E6B7D7|nr:N-acetylmuramoyl-L-alanine amidase [Thalassobacillus sp. CUG 92003]